MPLGTARSHGSSGEYFNHFTATRIRVVGAGSLDMTLFSPDEVNSLSLGSFTLAATNRVAPIRLTNFIEQRAKLQLKTDAINETFRVNRIVIYAKPVFAEEPA